LVGTSREEALMSAVRIVMDLGGGLDEQLRELDV
jgi:hypothetical protein